MSQQQKTPPLHFNLGEQRGILKKSSKNKPRRAAVGVSFPKQTPTIITPSSDHDDDHTHSSSDEEPIAEDPFDSYSIPDLLEKSSITTDEKEFLALTQKNTNFNSIKTNLLGKTNIQLGPLTGGRGGKPLVTIGVFGGESGGGSRSSKSGSGGTFSRGTAAAAATKTATATTSQQTSTSSSSSAVGVASSVKKEAGTSQKSSTTVTKVFQPPSKGYHTHSTAPPVIKTAPPLLSSKPPLTTTTTPPTPTTTTAGQVKSTTPTTTAPQKPPPLAPITSSAKDTTPPSKNAPAPGVAPTTTTTEKSSPPGKPPLLPKKSLLLSLKPLSITPHHHRSPVEIPPILSPTKKQSLINNLVITTDKDIVSSKRATSFFGTTTQSTTATTVTDTDSLDVLLAPPPKTTPTSDYIYDSLEIQDDDVSEKTSSDSGTEENDYNVQQTTVRDCHEGVYIRVTDDDHAHKDSGSKQSPSSDSAVNVSSSSDSSSDNEESNTGRKPSTTSTNSNGSVKRQAPPPPPPPSCDVLYDDVTFCQQEEEESLIYDDCSTSPPLTVPPPSGTKDTIKAGKTFSYSFNNDTDTDSSPSKRTSSGIQFMGLRKIDSESFLQEAPVERKASLLPFSRMRSLSPETTAPSADARPKKVKNNFFSTIGKRAGAAWSNSQQLFGNKSAADDDVTEDVPKKPPSSTLTPSAMKGLLLGRLKNVQVNYFEQDSATKKNKNPFKKFLKLSQSSSSLQDTPPMAVNKVAPPPPPPPRLHSLDLQNNNNRKLSNDSGRTRPARPPPPVSVTRNNSIPPPSFTAVFNQNNTEENSSSATPPKPLRRKNSTVTSTTSRSVEESSHLQQMTTLNLETLRIVVQKAVMAPIKLPRPLIELPSPVSWSQFTVVDDPPTTVSSSAHFLPALYDSSRHACTLLLLTLEDSSVPPFIESRQLTFTDNVPPHVARHCSFEPRTHLLPPLETITPLKDFLTSPATPPGDKYLAIIQTLSAGNCDDVSNIIVFKSSDSIYVHAMTPSSDLSPPTLLTPLVSPLLTPLEKSYLSSSPADTLTLLLQLKLFLPPKTLSTLSSISNFLDHQRALLTKEAVEKSLLGIDPSFTPLKKAFLEFLLKSGQSDYGAILRDVFDFY